MSNQDAAGTSNQAMAFLRHEHDTGSTAWKSKCLALQRTARGLPPVYPSALSAMHATPKNERVPHITDLRRGMVAYSDDPHDGNPYGHIYGIAGWRKNKPRVPENLMTWSNDVIAGKPGAVGFVPITFYDRHWGDNFQFGATWLNGYNFADLDKAPVPAPGRETIGSNLNHAIEDIRKAIRYHRRIGDKATVAALVVDLRELQETRRRFPR